jgi:hypothetical protein
MGFAGERQKILWVRDSGRAEVNEDSGGKYFWRQMNADFWDYTKYLKQFLPLDLCVLCDLCG